MLRLAGVPSAIREHPVTKRMSYTGMCLRLAAACCDAGGCRGALGQVPGLHPCPVVSCHDHALCPLAIRCRANPVLHTAPHSVAVVAPMNSPRPTPAASFHSLPLHCSLPQAMAVSAWWSR